MNLILRKPSLKNSLNSDNVCKGGGSRPCPNFMEHFRLWSFKFGQFKKRGGGQALPKFYGAIQSQVFKSRYFLKGLGFKPYPILVVLVQVTCVLKNLQLFRNRNQAVMFFLTFLFQTPKCQLEVAVLCCMPLGSFIRY